PRGTPPPRAAPPPQGTQPPQNLQSQPTGAVVSARAGQRTAMSLPPPQTDGIHLSLEEAIRVALANNQDLNVTVNSAEAASFFLFQQSGIYDPLLQGFANRNHQEAPSSSSLSGAPLSVNQDTYNFGANVTQLTPWGGI